MTFGEHLEELRKCLFRAIVGLAIGFVIGLFLGNQVVKLIQDPLEKALTKHYVKLSQKEVATRLTSMASQGQQTAYSADGAAEFISSQQMLVDEYLISPRDVLIQVPGSLRRIRERREDSLRQLAAVKAKLERAANGTTGEKITAEDRAFLLQLGLQTAAESVENNGNGTQDPAADKDSQGLQNSPQLRAAMERLAQNDWETVVDGPMYGVLAEAVGSMETSLQATLDHLDNLIRSYDLTEEAVGKSLSGQVDNRELIHIFAWRPAKDDSRVRAKSLSAHEAFSIYIKASLLVGAILSAPWVFLQIWSFVAAGLYRHERKFVYTFLPFSLALFFAGAAMAFLYVFEPVLTFLFQFNEWMGIQLEPRISDWLSFVLILPLGFGIGFQLPLIMLFLERIGIFTVKDYLSQWKMAILVIFVASAILTPPDPSSQLLMAVPLSLLYFGGLLLCKFFPRSRSGFSDGTDSSASTA
ncbi:twin-arginine translocase subunit TatC [Thermopirellula anaerolimosa]